MKTQTPQAALQALSPRLRKGAWLALSVLGLGAAVWAMSPSGRAHAANGAQTLPALPLRTVQLRPVALSFPADGVVEALRQATVAAQVPGRVLEVKVDAGQPVKAGQLLMRLDVREAAASTAAARATAINAQANYERMVKLHQQNFISQAGLDKAKADYDAARANLGAAGATASHGAVTAPLTGMVAQRLTELGEMAEPGRPLFILYDPAALRVTVNVPQWRLSQVRATGQAMVEFPELGRRLPSASVQLLPAADPATHTAQLRVNLPAGAGRDIVPGMAARIHLTVGRANKLTVPPAAVVRRGEVAAVYVQSGGSLRLRQLRLGEPVADGELEVLAGLAPGETIVLDAVKAGIALKQATGR